MLPGYMHLGESQESPEGASLLLGHTGLSEY
jgi:hypothetical protein